MTIVKCISDDCIHNRKGICMANVIHMEVKGMSLTCKDEEYD